jgi:hypothetical protein
MNDESNWPISEGPKSWTSVGYTIGFHIDPRTQPPTIRVSGKACGIRNDGMKFWAAYDLPIIYPAAFDWTQKAKERLDTFLDCTCSTRIGSCAYHQMLSDEWMKEDELRNSIMPVEIPDALKDHVMPTGQNAVIVRPA